MGMIDSEKLLNDLYILGFETDGDSRWDSGLWLRYRAVENLIKGQPTVEAPDINVGNMDAISRQAAIDAINEQIEQCNKALGSFDISLKDEYAVKVERASLEAYKEQLENMPTIQPDTTTHDSIPAETGKNDGVETSGGCISRQAAIDTLKELTANGTNKGMVFGEDAVHRIEMLPSAQPERKTGHWILDRSGSYCCSKCMEPCASYVMRKPRDKYCKMCGSRNEVME